MPHLNVQDFGNRRRQPNKQTKPDPSKIKLAGSGTTIRLSLFGDQRATLPLEFSVKATNSVPCGKPRLKLTLWLIGVLAATEPIRIS